MVAAELAAELADACARRQVAEVRLGRAYAAVRLDSGEIGLAHMPYEPAIPCPAEPEAGTLAGRPALELARRAADDGVNAAMGLAALNAAALSLLRSAPTGDIRDQLELTRNDHVGMVGLFAPLVRWIRETGATLTILERRPSSAPGVCGADQAPAVLPQCSVALISSTTLINHTLADLLPLCGAAREAVLLGPSTPLAPDFFAARGVTILAGVRPADPERLLSVVSEGGGMQQFKSAVRKVAFRLAPAR